MNNSAVETKKMKLSETLKVVLMSRGALGLQLLFKMDTDSVVEVKRMETGIIKTDPIQPGDPINAVFEIRSIKEGTVRITFYETQPWNKEFTPIIQKELEIEVSK